MNGGRVVSLDFKKFIDQRCDEGEGKLVELAEACLTDDAGPQEEGAFISAMDEVWLLGSDELQALFPTENLSVKRYYHQRVKQFLSPSVFWSRVFEKPRGYAGDYLMMDMVYLCRPLPGRGEHRHSDLFDDWFLNEPTAQAARNRHAYLAEMLKSEYAAGARKIASLASGPCREVRTFVDQTELVDDELEFVFVDFDEEALAHGREVLAPHGGDSVKCHYVNENLLKLILGRKLTPLANYDLVYSTGFADYLNDRLLGRLVEAVHGMLGPGGRFVLGQFVDFENHPDRNGLEWVTDWNLVYRTPEDLESIYSNTPFRDGLTIETEPKGIIMFAEATKV